MKADLIEDLVGRNVFVRTVTYHYTGRLETYNKHWLMLSDAAWIADSGRFADFLTHGEASEVEPYPDACFVSRGSVVDISLFVHPLPRIQK